MIKRGMTAALALLLFAACSKEASVEPAATPPSESENPYFVSYEEALEGMSDLIEFIDGQTPSRSGKTRTIAGHYVHSFGAPSRSGGETGDEISTDVYVVNFEDEQGFAILASDERLPEVFALAESGNLDLSEPVENPGLGIFLNNLGAMLMAGPGDFTYDNQTFRGPWENSSMIGSVIASQWGQGAPYNLACSAAEGKEVLTGCVATAVAQVMYHHKYPAAYRDENGTIHSYDWNSIVTHKSTNASWPPAHNQIADLFLMLGASRNLHTNYGTNGSDADEDHINRTFANFSYSNKGSQHDYSVSRVNTSIANGSPVPVCGFAKRINNFLGIFYSYDEGHVWVIDAILTQQRRVDDYYQGTHTVFYETRNLHHYNWGWNGRDNGYYAPEVFHVDGSAIEDNSYLGSSGNGNQTYRYQTCIFTDIRP